MRSFVIVLADGKMEYAKAGHVFIMPEGALSFDAGYGIILAYAPGQWLKVQEVQPDASSSRPAASPAVKI